MAYDSWGSSWGPAGAGAWGSSWYHTTVIIPVDTHDGFDSKGHHKKRDAKERLRSQFEEAFSRLEPKKLEVLVKQTVREVEAEVFEYDESDDITLLL